MEDCRYSITKVGAWTNYKICGIGMLLLWATIINRDVKSKYAFCKFGFV
jgi:hypothetical protein